MIRRCLAVLALLEGLAGCGKAPIERVEWPVMGTIAAVQTRGGDGLFDLRREVAISAVGVGREMLLEVERSLNAHDPKSELSQLASLDEAGILARCDSLMRPCYEAAFRLMKESDGAFNPRWKGPKTLDLGAIAKGFAVDYAASGMYFDGNDALLDLGGNLKALRGEGGPHKDWSVGVKNPQGDGFCAVVQLKTFEALATSATYYRGSHIHDGRTGKPVTNGVASVTVLHPKSAMLADGLSTTLFVLGPEKGKDFVEAHYPESAVLWIMEDGRRIRRDAENRFELK